MQRKKNFRYDPKEVITVYIGINRGDITKEKKMKKKRFSVVDVIVHPDWKGWGGYGPDIALIKLRNKIKFKKNYVFPICLASRRIYKQIFGKKVYVAGNRFVHCLRCGICGSFFLWLLFSCYQAVIKSHQMTPIQNED